MPLPGPFYPNLESIMNLARALVNDSYNSGAGEILTDSNPATILYINRAFAELQDRLENIASVTLTKDNYIVTALDPVVNPAPGIQTSLSFTGYTGYNGAAVDSSLTLPSDMMAPEEVWERPSGSTNAFRLMQQPQAGLPSQTQTQWLRLWEWRTDTLNFLGATIAVDLRIRYRCRQAYLPPNSTTAFVDTTVNILGCERTMAYLIATAYAEARGAEGAAMMRAGAEAAILELKKRIVRQMQGTEFRRRPYKEQGGNGSLRLPW